ncbi:MAG: rRNA maturation RNase YbeY [Lachnospiraceae bacterium]|nr:rRNA maturation RNase YbeY [Lachnospiraceae bacterium]
MTVIIDYDTDIKLGLPYEELIKKVVAQCAETEHCPYEVSVNVLLTDNEAILDLNREFRGVDSPTDVLSFPSLYLEEPDLWEAIEEDPGLDFDPDTGELVVGDIAVSVEKVMSQAKEYGHSEERELAFLVAHSMLHLFGFDHIEEADRLLMEAEQRKILDALRIYR